ncbi:MAG: hypothetical protein JWL73_29 [Actinomycetia bacterium]|nr:hypothetical protein [Actinomycetes bacterium]
MGFLAIAVGLALAAVLFTRGSFKRLTRIPIVSAWVLILALAIQVALEYVHLDRARYDDLGIGLLMFSYALLLGFCLVNLSVRGMGVLAIGVACNALVIGLNLGMPVKGYDGSRVSTTVKQQPAKNSDLLQFLGDIIVLPHPPFSESISFGDLILAVGLVDVAFWASRRRRTEAVASRDDGAVIAATAPGMTGAAVGMPSFVAGPPTGAPIDPFVDAMPVDVPTSELSLPLEAVITDDGTPARRPVPTLPGPVEDKVKQPVWDPHRTAPIPIIDAAPAQGEPAMEVAPVDAAQPPAVAEPSGRDLPATGIRTLWSAEDGADPSPVAEPGVEVANGHDVPPPEVGARRRRQGRRRRGATPPPALRDPQGTVEIDLSVLDVHSDAGGARRSR